MPRHFGLNKYIYNPETVKFIGRPVPAWKRSQDNQSERPSKSKEKPEKYYRRSLRKDLKTKDPSND